MLNIAIRYKAIRIMVLTHIVASPIMILCSIIEIVNYNYSLSDGCKAKFEE